MNMLVETFSDNKKKNVPTKIRDVKVHMISMFNQIEKKFGI